MFDYKLIEAFAAVVQEGGFEKAAIKLFITQSAVSQRIKHLEEQFGQVILLRSTPPRPTPFGHKLLGLYNQVTRLEQDLLGDTDSGDEEFTSLAIGLNADTLETWFFPVVRPFLEENRVVVDLMVDDQEETHRFLRDGMVLGCITTRKRPIQGCISHYLGDIEYGLFCTEGFRKNWFGETVTVDGVRHAPMITFNRKDKLQEKILRRILGAEVTGYPTHYIPSTDIFLKCISAGLAYGAMPFQQCRAEFESGKIVELAAGYREKVCLFWQCWNIDSQMLRKFTDRLLDGFSEC